MHSIFSFLDRRTKIRNSQNSLSLHKSVNNSSLSTMTEYFLPFTSFTLSHLNVRSSDTGPSFISQSSREMIWTRWFALGVMWQFYWGPSLHTSDTLWGFHREIYFWFDLISSLDKSTRPGVVWGVTINPRGCDGERDEMISGIFKYWNAITDRLESQKY